MRAQLQTYADKRQHRDYDYRSHFELFELLVGLALHRTTGRSHDDLRLPRLDKCITD